MGKLIISMDGKRLDGKPNGASPSSLTSARPFPDGVRVAEEGPPRGRASRVGSWERRSSRSRSTRSVSTRSRDTTRRNNPKPRNRVILIKALPEGY